MRDAPAWLATLTTAAPRVVNPVRIDRTLLRVLAATLANPETPPDLLLSIADAFIADATDMMLDGRVSRAAQLTWIAGLVTARLNESRPGFW